MCEREKGEWRQFFPGPHARETKKIETVPGIGTTSRFSMQRKKG